MHGSTVKIIIIIIFVFMYYLLL